MKDYIVKGNVVEITLDNDKVVKCSNAWVEKTMELLKTSAEDVILMWLEDNDYIVNEELEELDKVAKANKVKVKAESQPKKKTPKERVAKPQPEKEYIVGIIAEFLEDITDISNLKVENKAKLITFNYKGNDYKLDLVQKRNKKEENE